MNIKQDIGFIGIKKIGLILMFLSLYRYVQLN